MKVLKGMERSVNSINYYNRVKKSKDGDLTSITVIFLFKDIKIRIKVLILPDDSSFVTIMLLKLAAPILYNFSVNC